jgi:hypothetical protein
MIAFRAMILLLVLCALPLDIALAAMFCHVAPSRIDALDDDEIPPDPLESLASANDEDASASDGDEALTISFYGDAKLHARAAQRCLACLDDLTEWASRRLLHGALPLRI